MYQGRLIRKAAISSRPMSLCFVQPGSFGLASAADSISFVSKVATLVIGASEFVASAAWRSRSGLRSNGPSLSERLGLAFTKLSFGLWF